MQRYADRAGFQIRSNHYYEPTYSEADLPARTDVERSQVGLDLNKDAQLTLVRRFRFADELARISEGRASPGVFGMRNGMFELADAEVLYSLIRLNKPRTILEIGSGQSTLIAKLAIEANQREDSSVRCEQICVEPYENRWLETAGVTLIRDRIETLDPVMLDRLGENDILFIDSSHVIRPWGDVLYELQVLIPRVAPGVWVQIHDIYTPRDYPEPWLRSQRRLWNEQYLLECFLAFNHEFEVVCAVNWLKRHHFAELAANCPHTAANPERQPGSFWIRRKPSH